MVGPGSALRSVHPLPPSLSCHDPGRHICANVLQTPPPLGLERSNDPPPAPSQVPKSPLPGSGPGCNETVWFPSAGPAKTWRFPCHWPRCAGRRLSNRRCCSARDSASSQGNVFSPLGFPQVLASPETGIASWLSLEI